MEVIGIIAEYNPFHNGHAFMIEELRRIFPGSAILALMSGSFTQRGEAAMADKWQRGKSAIRGGCDLVLELPFAYAVRSAQDFARGAVLLLDRLGIVDVIAFGAECNDLEKMKRIAEAMDASETQRSLRRFVTEGASYAAALTSALSSLLGVEEEFLKQPNTILSMEYLRALRLTRSSLRPFPIQRQGAAHHQMGLHGNIASASAIRQELCHPSWNALKKVLPPCTLQSLKKMNSFPRTELLFRPVLAALRTGNLEGLCGIYGVNEGLEHRLLLSAAKSSSWEDLVDGAASKRYPKSRIRRLLIHLIAGFNREEAAEFDGQGPQYARILAFNDRGRMLLRRIKRESSLPLIPKVSQFLSGRDMHRPSGELSILQRMLRFDCLATDLQGICYPTPLRGGRDFLASALPVELALSPSGNTLPRRPRQSPHGGEASAPVPRPDR